ncbi:Cation efflux system protein CusF [Burkholderiaceae bacterium]|nr:Cation efflux system protein CusF [Burkholderiaceae bacterium]
MNKLTLITSAVAASLLLAAAARAGTAHSHDHAASAASEATAPATEGEVRKIDKEAKKITLKHGEIKNLGMPSMTMVFQVTDPALLDKVKVGDKVRFTAQKSGAAIAVSAIEPAQ